MTSFDAGRGCPFQCSFCTIINVQGRKSRRRSPDDVEAIIRANVAQGLRSFFITDDNFARNKDWEAILDRLIELREEEGFEIELHDPGRHAVPPDPELHREVRARRRAARVHRAGEHQSRTTCSAPRSGRTRSPNIARCCWPGRAARIITYAGYILGFPNDTPESILRDIEIIKRELPVDMLEFFFLTPLPGSEDHQKLHRARASPMDPDMNKYDLNHVMHGASRDVARRNGSEAYRAGVEHATTRRSTSRRSCAASPRAAARAMPATRCSDH